MKLFREYIFHSFRIALLLVSLLLLTWAITGKDQQLLVGGLYSIAVFWLLSILSFKLVQSAIAGHSSGAFMVRVTLAFILKILFGLSGFLLFYFLTKFDVKILIITYALSYLIFTAFVTIRLSKLAIEK